METPKARADVLTLQQAIDHLRGSASVLEGTTAILPAAIAIVLAIVLAQLAERDAVIVRLRKVAVKAEKLSSNPVTGPLLSADDRAAMMHDDLAMALSALQPGDLEAT